MGIESKHNTEIKNCLPTAGHIDTALAGCRQHGLRGQSPNVCKFRSNRNPRQNCGASSFFHGLLGSLPLRQGSQDLLQTGVGLIFPELLSFLISPNAAGGSTPIFTVFVSLVALSSALYVILSNRYPSKVQQWAYATVGMILGFWLRS